MRSRIARGEWYKGWESPTTSAFSIASTTQPTKREAKCLLKQTVSFRLPPLRRNSLLTVLTIKPPTTA